MPDTQSVHIIYAVRAAIATLLPVRLHFRTQPQHPMATPVLRYKIDLLYYQYYQPLFYSTELCSTATTSSIQS